VRFSHECGKKINERSEFSEILENKEGFENVVIQCLKEDLSRYGERGEYAAGAEVIIDEKKKATVLKCDIHGAISESEGEYYATFKWLLVPLGLDFIDDNFKESKEGLSWEGEVGGIQTGITIKLPPQESYTKHGSTLLGTVMGMSGGLAIAGMLGVAHLIFKRNMH